MIHLNANNKKSKGWFSGPWNSNLPIPVGYANEGIKEEHYHSDMFEIYLIARGTTTIVVSGREVNLKAGDMIAVEPGETHTFLDSSNDYFHFVVQTPFVKEDKILIT